MCCVSVDLVIVLVEIAQPGRRGDGETSLFSTYDTNHLIVNFGCYVVDSLVSSSNYMLVILLVWLVLALIASWIYLNMYVSIFSVLLNLACLSRACYSAVLSCYLNGH